MEIFTSLVLLDYRFSQAHKKPSDSDIHNWSSLEVSVFKCAIGSSSLIILHCRGGTSHVIIGYLMYSFSNSEAKFKEKHVVRDPTLKLIITAPYHSLVDSELRSPAIHPYEDECRCIFPKLFKNGTTNRERERTRKWKLYVLEKTFYGSLVTPMCQCLSWL